MRLFCKTKEGEKRTIYFMGIRFVYYKIRDRKYYNQIKKYISKVLKGKNNCKKLVVIPSDPIEAYKNKGIYERLQTYYNPLGFFDEVFLLSPLEKGIEYKCGMHIIGVNENLYKKAVEQINPNVIRAYGGYWATTFAVNNKVKNIPVVCSVHDTNEELLFEEIKGADKIICMSKACRDLVKAKGVQIDKITIMPNRVDQNLFKQKTNLENLKKIYPDNYKYILFVGRATQQKNIDNVLKALSILPDEYKCFLVGHRSDDTYIKLAEELGVQNKCIWIDSIINSELPDYYSFADCMCTPSRWEGFGIVFIEAASCQAPVITSNIVPMNEYFTHNENAYLIDDYENPAEIAKAIEFVCNNKEYSEKIGKNARTAVSKFSKEKVDEMEVNIYKSIFLS